MTRNTFGTRSGLSGSPNHNSVPFPVSAATNFQCKSTPTARGRAQPNMRLKLAACGRRLRRNAQWRLSILSAASASRSLSAIR
jgi:hypothetical protein